RRLEHVDKALETVNTLIAKTIEDAAKAGDTVATQDIVSRLNDLREYYKTSDTPTEFIRKIDDYEKAIVADHGKAIPVNAAQKIKQNIYKQLKDSYGEFTNVA